MRKGLFSADKENRTGQQFHGMALWVRRYRAGYDYEGTTSPIVFLKRKSVPTTQNPRNITAQRPFASNPAKNGTLFLKVYPGRLVSLSARPAFS
jgi:hypothetical protein